MTKSIFKIKISFSVFVSAKNKDRAYEKATNINRKKLIEHIHDLKCEVEDQPYDVLEVDDS